MIRDAEFKKLKHHYINYEKFTNGQELEIGYKPDYVLKSPDKENYIILESEGSTSRKTYIGGMAKAAHFLTDNKTGILIYVINVKENTKSNQIIKQLELYFKWLKPITNLKNVYLIEDKDYLLNSKQPIPLLEELFMLKSFSTNS